MFRCRKRKAETCGRESDAEAFKRDVSG